MIEAEVEPVEVESDENYASVSAKKALKCCLLLRSYFISSYEDTRLVQSDMDKMSAVIRNNRHARAKSLHERLQIVENVTFFNYNPRFTL